MSKEHKKTNEQLSRVDNRLGILDENFALSESMRLQHHREIMNKVKELPKRIEVLDEDALNTREHITNLYGLIQHVSNDLAKLNDVKDKKL